MPETILVVEYEPRYTDRVRQALAGHPFTTAFAKDGDEALRAIAATRPTLIVLSSVIPRTTTSDLIRAIRSQSPLEQTPILLTVSGYTGKMPRADAERVGASDILPKPYTESDFLGKVQQMLGISASAADGTPNPDYGVHGTSAAGGQLTSNEIFGDLLTDDKPAAAAKKSINVTGDVDKMLESTLAGMMPQRKTSTGIPRPVTSPGTEPRPRTQPGAAELDKILHDTLSGLERGPGRPKSNPPAVPQPSVAQQTVPAPEAPARPIAPPPVAPPPVAPPVAAPTAPVVEKVSLSSPVIPSPAPQPVIEKPAEEEQEPVDGIRFGQYVLLDKIATGGMAEVWKARMRGVEGFQKIVAIKKILPHLSDNRDFIDMFIDEAKLAAQLTHNNIIHIYDLGKIQSSYYIAMEYVDGWDLKTILKKAQDRDQPLTVELALFITSKIAAALDYAHRRRDFNDQEMGLVHRDVSPQNVLISQEGDIKLCDFGIAKAASKASHTQAGALKGKLQYMSPEQAWGRAIDRRSDIFALAAVLFELLTGRKLFSGDNELSILEQVREARVIPPSQINEEVTPEIDQVVLKALHKDPENRYQTAGEMARDIDQILYTFRPTPTSADLAIFMHRLSTTEPVRVHPDLDETVIDEAPAVTPVIAAMARPVAAAVPAATPVVPPPPVAAAPSMFVAERAAKKAPIVPIAIAAVVVIAIGIGAFVMMRGKGQSAAPAATSSAVAQQKGAVAPGAAPASTTAAPESATAPVAAAAASTDTAIDQTKVDAEVQKRLEAERAKLEQLARSQQPQTQTAAAARPPAARPPVQTASVAPPPVTETHAPVPVVTQTVAPPPVQTETHAPAVPQPVTETVARAKEGDLITGGEGLTAPRLLRLSTPEYPLLARQQRVEGLVLMSVLISEKGQVMQVKLLRGVNRPVGLNEAAEAAVRRSTFAPGMKDGVHVKAWMTVPINFKL